MPDALDQYLSDAPATVPDDYLDLQAAALTEIGRLSESTVAPLRDQVESAWRRLQREQNTKAEKAGHAAQLSHNTRKQAVDEEHRRLIDQARTEYQDALEHARSTADAQRDDLNASADARLAKANDQCRYDLITAENIRDGSVLQADQAYDQAAAQTDQDRRELDQLADHANAVHEFFAALAPDLPEVAAPEPAQPDPAADYQHFHALARQRLDALQALLLPRAVNGAAPWMLLLLLAGALAAGAAVLGYYHPFIFTNPLLAALAAAALAAALTVILGLYALRALRRTATRRLSDAQSDFLAALAGARNALDHRLAAQAALRDQRRQHAHATVDAEKERAQSHLQRIKQQTAHFRDTAAQKIESDLTDALAKLRDHYEPLLARLQNDYDAALAALAAAHARDLAAIDQQRDTALASARDRHDHAADALSTRWRKGLDVIEALARRTPRLDSPACLADWSDPYWTDPASRRDFASFVRFGRFTLDPAQLAPEPRRLAADLPDTPWHTPACIAFHRTGSLLLESPRQGRDAAIAALRSTMLRLLLSLPPGRVRFTIIDPVGLGENFAGFMHAADEDPALVGPRIWTDPAQVAQQLTDLTEHMENVIQKYLRNEFDTIEAYNAQAGELAEPYRFLVLADFPTNFSEESAKRLASILQSGPRCGVFVLIHRDLRQPLPPGLDHADLHGATVHVRYENDHWRCQDPALANFPLALDAAPDDALLTSLVKHVASSARDASRVEVPFEQIIPSPDRFWSADASRGIDVPIGRTGATRLQSLRLGRGMAQHALIAGRTGSGKSTLLHVMITNLALWYSPREVELYLVDFKRGVEFKTYVNHNLPHARVVAIESDREFGLSVLQRLDQEMARRAALFRQAGVQDLAQYRQATQNMLPRVLLLVDEFQIFFAEDDKLAQDAALLLEQLVRQGRAFGVHVVLGSQTLGGATGLARSTMGQMSVRIALQCSETDAQLILDDSNVAARLLSRPGEAIYNDSAGLSAANAPFQTAWLPEAQRDDLLAQLPDRARQLAASEPARPKMIFFEGNVPADLAANDALQAALAAPHEPKPPVAPATWLGEPTAIKDPTAVFLRPQAGANLLITGQRDEAANALFFATLLSLAAQHAPEQASFVLLDGSAEDAPYAHTLASFADKLPHKTTIVPFRDVESAIADLADEVSRRIENHALAPHVYLLLFGLQRYRALRRSEDDFSFSLSDEPQKPRPDKQLATIIQEGPALAVHTLVWADTLASVERVLDRPTLREFDNLVLFQMSAADSSHLIDSPAANDLGFHRALLYSEQRGLIERFRPYAPPPDDFLTHALQLLNRKT